MRQLVKLTVIAIVLMGLAIPLPALAATGGPYTAGFQLQNLSGTTATITINYYDQAGSVVASVPDSISANSSKTYFPLSSVPTGFNGSVVVSSNQQLAAIANVLITDLLGGASYSGFTAGATTVNIPLAMKNNAGYSTWFNVQNTGTSTATVNVTYKGSPTPAGGCPESQSVAPGASKTFDQSVNGCLATGFIGAATVTSAQAIVATVMEIKTASKSLLAYSGFTTSSTTLVMPLLSTGYFASLTGVQIQNTGASSTNVTMGYTPSSGFPGSACSETKSIAAGSSTTFFLPKPVACGSSFVGSGRVTNNSAGMPLVAIVNQITTGATNGSSYSAVNPANATSKVSLPLIMDRNFGYFTGFSVANVGSSTTNVSCTFSGSGAPPNIPSTAVAPGAALTSVQLNKGTAGYVGSATCTASGGDAKIAAIVNELQTGAATTSDVLLTYEGSNY